MSDSIRGSKSSRNNSCGSGCSSSVHGKSHDSIPCKFSSIVYKVESLISKMNYDKQNNANRSNGNQYSGSHKKTKLKPKFDQHLKANIKYESSANLCNILRTASIDSLNNLSDIDSFDGHNDTTTMNTTATSTTSNANDIYSDSDDAETDHITGTTSVQVHRRIDLDQLTDETIREFNEQCSSLSHDMEFYNSWQNDEELERISMHKQSNENIYMDSSQEPFKEFQQSSSNHQTNTKDSNNNECTSVEVDNQVDKVEMEEIQKNNLFESETDKSLSHTKKAVSKTTQLKISLVKEAQMQTNLNEIEIDNAIDDLSFSGTTNQGLNATNGNVSKTRRSSVASSGSVGRMETILEEPIECKISVKEILHRFETMNKNETPSKASTLSSGVRAAAQTLNVPIERLESRQSNHREQISNASHSDLPQQHNTRNTSPPTMSGLFEAQHIHHQSQQQQLQPSQQNLHQQQSHKREQFKEQLSRNIHDGISDSIDHHAPVPQGMHNYNGHEEGAARFDEREHYNEHHKFEKQQSFLHSTRKSSSQIHPPNTNARNYQSAVQHGYQSQNLDTNYMTEEQSGGTTSPSVTRFSLLQFAIQHFRNDQIIDSRTHGRDTSDRLSNRSYAELVKWQGVPINVPLLRLPNDLAPLATECFDCILRYCGDIAMEPDLTEVKCVYTVLMHCHKYLALRDEVYCQLMKQTTANRSSCPDSTQRGWRLLSILAAYFGCSDALRPYLIEHLNSAASDRRRSCHGTAAVCLTNLRKTARCGGRKNVPSVEEVTAVSAGRSARRQIYRLPGGAERVVNTRCSTVVADVISELCALLGIESETEQQEFSLYCIVQGDAFTMPLAADEYILDVTTELLKSGQPFYLIFCRSVWHFTLKRDPAPTPLYVEVLFNQVAPDYLEGLLLELPSTGVPLPEIVRDMARIAALLHRAADLSHIPAMKEIKFLLPKPALGIREIRPAQWVGLVQSAWPQVATLSPGQVKAQFLNVLSAWPLFGSSFFAVKRIWADEGNHVEESPIWRDLILALNRRGVLFLDPNTHETLQHWPFMEVISTRKVRSEDGALFLDMKVGNLMQQRVIRVQTEQAHEISRLVRQYITMAQISQREKRETN